MADHRNKSLSYRRAEYLIGNPASINLASCITQAINQCKTGPSRTISRGGGQQVRLADIRSDDAGGHYLHITVDTPGESASIVPEASPTLLGFDVKTAAPPRGADFMDGDAFIYVRGNNVCLCTTGFNDTGIHYFLRKLFEIAHIRQDATQFELMKVASVSKISLIQNQGVKEVELRCTLYKATSQYINRMQQPVGLLRRIGRDFRALIGAPHDVNDDALRVSLNLKVDHRSKKGVLLGEKRLESLAISAINNFESGDEFVIVTNKDQRISESEIFVKSMALIEAHGKSVNKDKAWEELKVFYQSLSSSGVLEQ